jgi:hypothetical protein
MQYKKTAFSFLIAGMALIIATGVFLATAGPASAQCGSQASSCKNCHEVQGEKPVNNDGTDWHQSHAFGDFCYICHGGNQQATDETAAHAGMVPPLSDVKASCQQCHPNDLDARAQVYAKELGVEVGAGANPTPAAPASETPVAAAVPAQPATPASPQEASLAPNDPNLVDYVQRYNENALDKYPTNWGNVILVALIGALVIGGGALVVQNEGLVRVSFRETKPVEGEYPADVVDMVPGIAKLNPAARKSLRRLLEKPEATAEVLTSIEKLTSSDEK